MQQCVQQCNLCFTCAHAVLEAQVRHLQVVMQGAQPDSTPLLLSQSSVGSSVERHSSEESETIVCSLPVGPCRGDVSSASPARCAALTTATQRRTKRSRHLLF